MWILPVYLHGFNCWDASSRPKTLKQTIKTVEIKHGKTIESIIEHFLEMQETIETTKEKENTKKYVPACFECFHWFDFSNCWKKSGNFVKNQQIEYSDNRGYFGTTVKMQKTSKTKELCVWRKNYAVHWASKGIGCEWIHMI